MNAIITTLYVEALVLLLMMLVAAVRSSERDEHAEAASPHEALAAAGRAA